MSYGDTIIIASLSSLGLNNDELVENYKSIFNAGIGLLVPDYKNENGLSVFATTDYSFSALSISEEEFKVLCNQLSFQTITSLRGRKKLEVTDEFKEIYWKYERYAIDPGTACKNKFYAISKNTFRRLCDVYEKSIEYEEDLEEQESRYNIHGIPKRHGVISAELEAMIHTVAGGADFEDACALHGITINLTHFMRIYAKFFMPKKFIVKLTNDRRDYDLIESLQPSYDKT